VSARAGDTTTPTRDVADVGYEVYYQPPDPDYSDRAALNARGGDFIFIVTVAGFDASQFRNELIEFAELVLEARN
jgi:hypothetical protein